MFRVAITTTPDRASTLIPMVTDVGLHPVSLPCIETVPASDDILETARAIAKRADWLLVTSSRAITVVWPQRHLPKVEVAAVGKATADAIARVGGSATLVGDAGAGELVGELLERVSGRSVFFPHAFGADPSIIESLREAGADVTALAVYETRPIPPRSSQVEAAVFGSPSAVSGWCLSRSLDDLVLAAIGETTSAALGNRGHWPDVVPSRPDYGALLALLTEELRTRSRV